MFKETYYICNFKSILDSNEEEAEKYSWEEAEVEIEQADQILFENPHYQKIKE